MTTQYALAGGRFMGFSSRKCYIIHFIIIIILKVWLAADSSKWARKLIALSSVCMCVAVKNRISLCSMFWWWLLYYCDKVSSHVTPTLIFGSFCVSCCSRPVNTSIGIILSLPRNDGFCYYCERSALCQPKNMYHFANVVTFNKLNKHRWNGDVACAWCEDDVINSTDDFCHMLMVHGTRWPFNEINNKNKKRLGKMDRIGCVGPEMHLFF